MYIYRYVIEKKDLSYHTGDWDVAYKDVDGESFAMKDYIPERDYLYRVRATNEFGESDPSMVASYYGRPGMYYCV